MATEEERYLSLVDGWNAAHAPIGQSVTVLRYMNMNGHGVAWCECVRLDDPARPDGNKSSTHLLLCDHHLQVEDLDPVGYPRPNCTMHQSACVHRQLELHDELVKTQDVINAGEFYDSQLNGWAVFLIAVLQRMANNEFVGVPGNVLTDLDIQRLIFGFEIEKFSLDELLKVIKSRLYKREANGLTFRKPGITEIARIGNPPTQEGDK